MSKKEYHTEEGDSALATARRVTEQAQEVAGSIGERIESAEEALHDTFQRAKKGASEAIETVKDGIHTSAKYLEEGSLAGAFEDVETIIRRYPFQTLIVGFGLGYLFSRIRNEN